MNLKSVKIIAVDFDGTLCENSWPEIGEPNEELIEYLRNRKKDGDKLILWTCRVEDMLQKAVEWVKFCKWIEALPYSDIIIGRVWR